MSQQFTAKEVGEHNTVDKGLYVIVDSNVYELGGFVDEHPGGAKILKRVGGKDATKQFWKVHDHNSRKLRQSALCSLTIIVSQRVCFAEIQRKTKDWNTERGFEVMI